MRNDEQPATVGELTDLIPSGETIQFGGFEIRRWADPVTAALNLHAVQTRANRAKTYAGERAGGVNALPESVFDFFEQDVPALLAIVDAAQSYVTFPERPEVTDPNDAHAWDLEAECRYSALRAAVLGKQAGPNAHPVDPVGGA